MDMVRRSLRAYRASQPQSTSSYNSSLTSHIDRAMRSNSKPCSSEKIFISSSSSTETLDESTTSAEEAISIQTRRKHGRTEEHNDKSLRSQSLQAHNLCESDQVSEDDETVRCICGLDDYPGLPKPEEVISQTQDTEDSPLNLCTDTAEDLAGFFLQCDFCKVWQHGGCVGIKNEGSSPEEYFCEMCRKDLHRIFTAKNGQRYSHYLPLQQSLPRLSPRSTSQSKDKLRSPRGTKMGRTQSLQNINSKRRSTMNSRDAAYDEEEQIRRAIKASKDDRIVESTDGGLRSVKRCRSDSEEKLHDPKKHMTKSISPSLSQESNQVNFQVESDKTISVCLSTSKKTRGIGPKISKEKDQKDDREKLRSDVAVKRNGRAERKRIDGEAFSNHLHICSSLNADSELQIDTPSGSKNIDKNIVEYTDIPASIDSLKSPIKSYVTISENLSTSQLPQPLKRGGRPMNLRRGKLGRNHHSKERDLQEIDHQHSNRSNSRDTLKIDDIIRKYSNKGVYSEIRVGKSKGNFNKITMTDMKKRVSAILDFISRTQLEMASESVYHTTEKSTRDLVERLTETVPTPQTKYKRKNRIDDSDEDERGPSCRKEFKDLSCRDMMDVLAKQLIKWQNEFL